MYVSINQRTLLRRDTLEFAPTPAAVFNSDEEDGDTDEQPEEEEPPAADVWAEAAEEAEEEYVLAWVRSNARAARYNVEVKIPRYNTLRRWRRRRALCTA